MGSDTDSETESFADVAEFDFCLSALDSDI